MKNISIMILLASVAMVFSVAAFLLERESRYSVLPYSGERPLSSTAAELRKTESALQQIERLQTAGDFSLNDPDDLLPARNAQKHLQAPRPADANSGNVFPVLNDNNKQNGHGGISRLAEILSKNAAQQNYIGSGYTAPAAVSRSSNENVPVKTVTVHEPVQDLHRVSFIYVSADIRRAIVDDTFVQEGDVLTDGAHVTVINNGYVNITKNEKEYSLIVPKSLSAYSKPGDK